MDPILEVEGRHALFFDDDANAAFVNSKEALIEWNSLFIDRYDVRHLLSSPPSSFRNLNLGSSVPFDSSLESQLDFERYADLPDEDDNRQEVEAEVEAKDMSGYHNVSFAYGTSTNSTLQKDSDAAKDAPAFAPPFPLPESLLQNMPPTEKLHQIIARTAIFVSKHGGQSEIVLRVKQGDNPTFGFLMPDHHLHPYFRYLVDHTQLLKADNNSKSEDNDKNDNQHNGALSLLGSVYGSGEDEDGAAEVERIPHQRDSSVISDVTDTPNSSGNMAGKDRKVSKLLDSSKVKESVGLSKNRVFVKPAYANGIKKDSDVVHSCGRVDLDKSKVPSMFPVRKGETSSLVDPPSEVKRLVDRMVEIILKNGKDFESVLIEQDKKHGKFPFLLPSNQYHSYYLEVLKKAQEARVTGKSFGSEKDISSWQETDKKPNTKESNLATGELPLEDDQDRKEKFKMVINKSKKESQDQPSKETHHHTVISVDAAAAILQAATRGIKKPNLSIFSKSSNPGSSNEVAQASSDSFQPPSAKNNGNRPSVTVPVAKEFAKTAAVAAAGEADSSEAGLTREQKLKAERLRRAKMFAAMIKSGSAPLAKEQRQQQQQPLRSSSVEPSGVASTGVNGEGKEREGSVVPEKLVKINGSGDEHEMKSRKTRHYRSRQHDDNEEDENEVDEEDDDRRSRKKHKSHRSRSKDRHKRRRKHSSKSKGSRHHRKHEVSSEDDGHRSHHRHKHDDSEEDDSHRHHHRHKHDDSEKDDNHRHHHRHKHDDSEEDDGHRHKRDDSEEDDNHRHHRRDKRDDSEEDDGHRHHRRHKRDESSEDEHKRHKRRARHDISDDEDDDGKHRRRKHRRSKKEKDRKEREEERGDEVELEEGEIISNQSASTSVGDDDNASREASVGVSKSSLSYEDKRGPSGNTTEVPDELRAKIRAMLLATM